MVQNRQASWTAESVRDQSITTLPRATPAITGRILKACLPKAENPIMVRIPPTVGPFRSPPDSRIKAMPIRPFTPVLMHTGAGPNMRR